jgi:hypothetical protein
VAAWLFALHPLHVESVAWISSRKDVLALLFVGLATLEYVRPSTRSRLVWLWVLLGVFSKSASVVLPVLLWTTDYWLQRKPRRSALAGVVVICAGAAWIHLKVGQSVGMLQSPAGGSRGTALINASRSLLSYFELTLWPPSLALIHDPDLLVGWTWGAAAGLGALLAVAALAAWRHFKANDRLPGFCLLWFLAPLAPVTMLSLQNLVADRYLAVSVFGPCVAASVLLTRVARPVPRVALRSAVIGALAMWSGYRAWLFADPARVMADAAHRSPESRRAAFQYAKALEAQGDVDRALVSYRQAFDRTSGGDEAALRGALAIARIEDARRHRGAARAILEEAQQRYPQEQRISRRLRRFDRIQSGPNSPESNSSAPPL